MTTIQGLTPEYTTSRMGESSNPVDFQTAGFEDSPTRLVMA